jgi:hypothetical protein
MQKSLGKCPFGRPRKILNYNIKMTFRDVLRIRIG